MLRRSFLWVVLIVALVLGNGVVALAQEPAGAWEVQGRVTAVEAPNITIQTPRGEVVIVQTDRNTRFRVPGVENPTIADVRVGHDIVATGWWVAQNRFAARTVVVKSQPLVRVSGWVKELWQDSSGRGFILATQSGNDIIVVVSDDTRFYIPGVPNPGLEDLRKYDQAVVSGIPDTPAVTDATEVRRIIAKEVWVTRPRPITVTGRVKSIFYGIMDGSGEQGFVLTVRPDRDLVIIVTEETRFRIPGVEEPGLDDLEVGSQATVSGIPDPAFLPATDLALLQRLIAQDILVILPRPIQVAGKVKEILAGGEEQGFLLAVGGMREVTIIVTDETRFRIPGVEEPGLDDLRVGDQVLVSGIPDSLEPTAVAMPSRLIAQEVIVKRPPQIKIAGLVTAVDLNARTLTVQPDGGSQTIVVRTNDDTKFAIPGEPEPGLDKIVAGRDRVLVVGWPDPEAPAGSSQLLASHIVVQRPIPRPGRIIGVVKSVEGTTLTVEIDNGQQKTVLTDEHTRLCIPGVSNPSLEDFIGKRVLVVGFWEGEALKAKGITAIPDAARPLESTA